MRHVNGEHLIRYQCLAILNSISLGNMKTVGLKADVLTVTTKGVYTEHSR